jgi:hypothetical protein
MADPTPAYSLLPWVRRGLASQIADAPGVNFASLPLTLAVNGTAVTPAPHVRLPGPGDVKSIDGRAFIRSEPRDGADAFEPNFLAVLELATPDLPWMFTPAAPAGDRLKPWLCLIVLPDGDGISLTPRADGPAILRIDAPLDPAAELPDLGQIDAWAHAQIAGADLSPAALQADTGASLARLIAPRKLEAARKYLACVVPTYRAGVNAGLGLDVADSDLAPAWDATVKAPFLLPVYFQFRFQTGPNGDFASLARNIGPPTQPIAAGERVIDASEPGFGAAAAPGVTLGLEGALRPFGTQSAAWPSGTQAQYETQLRSVLAPPAAADPVVTPPVFGSTQTGQSLPADGKPPLWMGELNLDPRSRLAASAGGQVVQAQSEPMVASAWQQLGEIRKANQLLRQAQLAREVTVSINRRLQTVAGDGTYLQITSPVHSRVSLTIAGVSATLAGHVQASRLPVGAVSAAMRKLVRPRGPLWRGVATAGPQQIVDRLNLPEGSTAKAIVVAGPVRPPAGMVALDDVSPAVQLSKMSPAVLHAAAGWQLALPAATVGTVVATAPGTTSSVTTTPVTTAPGAPAPATTVAVATTPAVSKTAVSPGAATLAASKAAAPLGETTPAVSKTAVSPGAATLVASKIAAPPAAATLAASKAAAALGETAPGAARLDMTTAGTTTTPPSTQPIETREGTTRAAGSIEATTVATVVDWQTDTNVPAIFQSNLTTLPAPLVFPTDSTALAKMQDSFRLAATAINTRLTAVPPPAAPAAPPLGGSPALAATRSQLNARLDPQSTIQARFRARVPLGSGSDPLHPLSGTPRFPQAMYAPLADLSPDWMLPGIASIPTDTAVLLQTNPAFVEAYLVGLNEAFARELLWRQFPAERKDTWFQNFWNDGGTPDIPAIAQFDPNGHLGDHTQDHAHPGRLALLIRARLFQRYPNALVSAVPALWNADGKTRRLGSPRQWPIFRGQIGEDCQFFGFDIDDPAGVDDPAAGKPGWYFLLEEHITEPRFGLEPISQVPPTGTLPSLSWNDLSWADITPAGDFLNPAAAPRFKALEPVAWGQNAAAMAFILMRRPIRVAMHGAALLPKTVPPT